VAGCGLGFGDMKVIEIYELLDGIVSNKPIYPDFREGYKVNQVIDAALTSSEQERWVRVAE
jgi:predicted dehydrogenase